ncbi:MAG: hypothetical protein OHK0046_37390 [Anaerolineae bacterium]
MPSKSLLIILLFLLSVGVSANEVLRDENCIIRTEVTIEEDLLVLCGQLVIEGKVDGHVMGAARTAIIRGEVTGSLYLFAGELLLEGATIGKDVHFAGLILDMDEQTQLQNERSGLLSANLSTHIARGANIPGSVTQLGYQLVMDGRVGRDVSFWGSALQVGGAVERDITATVGDSQSEGAASRIQTLLIPFSFDVALIDPGLEVQPDASIRGSLGYTAPSEGVIEGTVGEVDFQQVRETIVVGTQATPTVRSIQRYIEGIFREFITLTLVGAVYLLAFPRRSHEPLRAIQSRPLSTLGVGLLSFILSFPIVLLLALASLLIVLILSLLPVQSFAVFGGIALGLANIGAASVFYFTAIYVARMVVALAIGRVLLPWLLKDDGTWRYRFVSLALGVLVLAVLVSVPVIGLLVNGLALFLGLGGILSVLRRQLNRYTTATRPMPQAVAPKYFEDFPIYTPPLLPERRVGTENLPEGFDWWGEDQR